MVPAFGREVLPKVTLLIGHRLVTLLTVRGETGCSGCPTDLEICRHAVSLIYNDDMPCEITFDEFCRLVQHAIESFPAAFQPYLENVAVDVFDEPADEDRVTSDERDADLADPDDSSDEPSELLGLFVGVPLTDQSYGHEIPNLVKIFRGPIQRASRNRRALQQNIRATILHEFAHHFGFSEEDLDAFEETQDKWLD